MILSRCVLFLAAFLFSVGQLSATVVLVVLLHDGAVIASDSLANRSELGEPRRQVCKIVEAAPGILFAVAGVAVSDDPIFDPYSLALLASSQAHGPTAAAGCYAELVAPTLQVIWDRNRARFRELAAEAGPLPPSLGPQDYVFLGPEKGEGLVAVGGFFRERNGSTMLEEHVFRYSAGPDDILIGRYGVFTAIPTDADVAALVERVGAPQALEWLIRLQSDDTPTLVGAPASVVVIHGDGKIEWVRRGECTDARP